MSDPAALFYSAGVGLPAGIMLVLVGAPLTGSLCIVAALTMLGWGLRKDTP